VTGSIARSQTHTEQASGVTLENQHGVVLVDSDNRLLAKAFASLAGGVLLVLITSFLIGLLNREIPATTEMMTRTAPNVFDLIIALGGGTAGAFAMIYKRLNAAFVGVAIATALVPLRQVNSTPPRTTKQTRLDPRHSG
jgi:uncharacterized membrane protein